MSVVLLAFKNHGHVDLAGPLAAALGGVLHAALARSPGPWSSGPVLLVPVPTRASSRRRRGYDPLMLLLARLDSAGGLPRGTVLAPAVRQLPVARRLLTALQQGGMPGFGRSASAVLSGLRGGQKGLGRRRRRAGVLDSMAVGRLRGALVGRDCIIVDDVLTTGATVGEVHRVLTAAGARVLGAVVLAATSSPAAKGSGRTPDELPAGYRNLPGVGG
ncbi:ComF family protein [Arthrobacter agilis]|uniref:ComF family protein n=1 Tax=Arthrobacter agilis TaxID=37921 RepID=UPI00277F4EA5|nr:phosphoribosyltransferase family protein [Arthrobacter agilis]MDQ0735539.1 putative amidophosphoribosyltransferase [Arthrobacter agilis]